MTAFISSCSSINDTKIEPAVELMCPGAPKSLLIGVTKEELRSALRKQFTHHKTRDTVLKTKEGRNIMIPTIRPRDLDRCLIRDIPKVVVPNSQGY